MLKLTIIDLENDKKDINFGSDKELLKYVKLAYSYQSNIYNLDDMLAYLNETGMFQAKSEPYVFDNPNVLPNDYLTSSSVEDPWPRLGD